MRWHAKQLRRQLLTKALCNIDELFVAAGQAVARRPSFGECYVRKLTSGLTSNPFMRPPLQPGNRIDQTGHLKGVTSAYSARRPHIRVGSKLSKKSAARAVEAWLSV
jgi:hypothetical protein